MVSQRVQELIRRRREKNIKRKIKAKRLPKMPDNIWRDYRKSLRDRVRIIENTFNDLIRPRLERWKSQSEANRPDSIKLDDDWTQQITDAINKLSKKTDDKLSDPEKLAKRVARQTDDFNKKDFVGLFEGALGVKPSLREEWKPATLNSFVRENVRLIRSLKEDSLNNMERIIQDGFRKGLTASEVAGNIRKRFEIDRNRSQRIARDQVGKLNGQLSKLRQKEAGIERFRWISALDSRVREKHQDFHGNVYKWNDPPDNQLPGEPINCFPGSANFAVFDKVNKLFRHFYTGYSTKLVANCGFVLESTNNHPVLTQKGWTAANDVNIGDYVFKARFECSDRSKINTTKTVASLGDVFNTSQILFGFSETRSGAGDFHGNITDQKIDIINVDSGLISEIDTTFAKEFCELIFTRTDFDIFRTLPVYSSIYSAVSRLIRAPERFISAVSKFFTFIYCQMTMSVVHSFTSISFFDSIFRKPALYDVSGNLISFRKLFDAESLPIQSYQFLNRQFISIINWYIASSGGGINSFLSQIDSNGIGRDTEFSGYLIDQSSLFITPQRIIDTVSGYFNIDVYNLETESGVYAVNYNTTKTDYTIVHNCRCTAQPVFEDLAEDINQ